MPKHPSEVTYHNWSNEGLSVARRRPALSKFTIRTGVIRWKRTYCNFKLYPSQETRPQVTPPLRRLQPRNCSPRSVLRCEADGRVLFRTLYASGTTSGPEGGPCPVWVAKPRLPFLTARPNNVLSCGESPDTPSPGSARLMTNRNVVRRSTAKEKYIPFGAGSW